MGARASRLHISKKYAIYRAHTLVLQFPHQEKKNGSDIFFQRSYRAERK